MAELTVRHTVLTASLDADPTVREYVIQRLSTDLMKSIPLATRFGGEIIVSLGPIKEIQVSDLCSVRFEQSMTLTPLVRCRDCVLARKPDRRKPAENRACEGTLICCVGFDHVYPDTDDGLIFVDENFYCAEGKRKDGGQDK